MLCVFDVNETLLDLAPMDALVGGPELRREWFGLAIHTVLTVTATGGYQDFAGIAGAAAVEVAARHGREVDLKKIGAGLRSLPAHPDVEAGLAKLREAGHTVVALTNSPLANAEAQLQNSGLAPLFDRIFSAEQAGRLKPAPEPYHQVAAEIFQRTYVAFCKPKSTAQLPVYEAAICLELAERDVRHRVPGWQTKVGALINEGLRIVEHVDGTVGQASRAS